MLRYTFGFIGAWLLAIVGGLFLERQGQTLAASSAITRTFMPAWNSYLQSAIAIYAIAIPGACAIVGACIAHKVRPRKVFDARVSGVVRPVLFGAIAGLLAVGATALLAAIVAAPEWLVLGGVSLGFAICGAMMLPGIRAGECLQCGYDLHEKPEARCPECGAVAGWKRIAAE